MARTFGGARLFYVHRWLVTAPPASPADEPVNLIDPVGPATGDFATYENHLAVYNTLFSAWSFIPISDLRGDLLYRAQENQWYNAFDGTGTFPVAQWHGTPVRGDLVVMGATIPDRLAVGTNTQILTSDGTDPVWVNPSTVAGTIDHGSLSGLSDSDHVVGALSFTATDRLAGRSTAGAGAGEEITCTAAGRALLDDADASAQRATLGLGALALKNTIDSSTQIDAGVIQYSDIQNVASARLLGNGSGGAASISELRYAGGIEYSGSQLQVSAFTGDVTKTAGGTALTIAANAVSNAKFRQSAGFSVVGKYDTGTGDVADITASVTGTVLKKGASGLAFETPRIFESAAWHTSAATAVGARTRGYVSTTSLDAGVCVPSGKTFKLWRQSACVKTGATAGSNYDLEIGVTDGVASVAYQTGTLNNQSNDTYCFIEAVASDAATPIQSIAGPARITLWWGVVAGSTGALASTQHSTQIVYSVE